MSNVQAAEVCVPSRALAADHAFFAERLGFRMESIYPADNPAVVVLVGHGVRLRLEASESGAAPARIRLRCAEPAKLADGALELTAPGGARIELSPAEPPLQVPATRHALLIQRLADEAPWITGRAGMLYRDLIPGRLGGAVIASHIRIPEAGPVPDLVHFHDIRFQLIFCCHGWVRLVYEDQGPPFILRAGDCVIQPPRIRHRVLEASVEMEVIEVGLPAEHLTRADHELELPTATLAPQRDFGGQRFCRSAGADGTWRPWRLPGYEARDTGIAEATGGMASVQVARPAGGRSGESSSTSPGGSGVPASVPVASHTADILFSFVLSGRLTLHAEGRATPLTTGDSFVIPPGVRTCHAEPSPDLELLEVALPGAFATELHAQPAAPRRRTGEAR